MTRLNDVRHPFPVIHLRLYSRSFGTNLVSDHLGRASLPARYFQTFSSVIFAGLLERAEQMKERYLRHNQPTEADDLFSDAG